MAYIGIVSILKHMAHAGTSRQSHACEFLFSAPIPAGRETHHPSERSQRDRHFNLTLDERQKYANCYVVFKKGPGDDARLVEIGPGGSNATTTVALWTSTMDTSMPSRRSTHSMKMILRRLSQLMHAFDNPKDASGALIKEYERLPHIKKIIRWMASHASMEPNTVMVGRGHMYDFRFTGMERNPPQDLRLAILGLARPVSSGVHSDGFVASISKSANDDASLLLFYRHHGSEFYSEDVIWGRNDDGRLPSHRRTTTMRSLLQKALESCERYRCISFDDAIINAVSTGNDLWNEPDVSTDAYDNQGRERNRQRNLAHTLDRLGGNQRGQQQLPANFWEPVRPYGVRVDRSPVNFARSANVKRGSSSRRVSPNFENAAMVMKVANFDGKPRKPLYVKGQPGMFTLDTLKHLKGVHPLTREHFGKTNIRRASTK